MHFKGYLLCGVLALTMTSAANAETITPSFPVSDPTYSGSFNVQTNGYICGNGFCDPQIHADNQNITSTGLYSYGAASPLISDGGQIQATYEESAASAYASFAFRQYPSPGMNMYGFAQSIGINGAGAAANIGNAMMNYSIVILGPTAVAQVQVNAKGAVTVSAIAGGGSSNNSAEVIFGIAGEFSDKAFVGTSGLTTSSFNATYTRPLHTNQVYNVYLYGNLYASVSGNLGGGDAEFSGYIDPTFKVVGDNADAYTLVFSPGIGNVDAVPEPSTWAMMILGFLGLGRLAYRRKRSAVGFA
jgi:PEP-CTERM motif